MKILLAAFALVAACGTADPMPPPVASTTDPVERACLDEFWVCYDGRLQSTSEGDACAALRHCRDCRQDPTCMTPCTGAEENAYWHECTAAAYDLCTPAFCDCTTDRGPGTACP